MFIETLRSTGFGGDVVLAIAHYSVLNKGVEDYLRSQKNVVVYIHELQCFETDEVTIGPRKVTKQGQLDVFQMCCLPNVYGLVHNVTGVVEPAPDPRIGRVVATIRYARTTLPPSAFEIFYGSCVLYFPFIAFILDTNGIGFGPLIIIQTPGSCC